MWIDRRWYCARNHRCRERPRHKAEHQVHLDQRHIEIAVVARHTGLRPPEAQTTGISTARPIGEQRDRLVARLREVAAESRNSSGLVLSTFDSRRGFIGMPYINF